MEMRQRKVERSIFRKWNHGAEARVTIHNRFDLHFEVVQCVQISERICHQRCTLRNLIKRLGTVKKDVKSAFSYATFTIPTRWEVSLLERTASLVRVLVFPLLRWMTWWCSSHCISFYLYPPSICRSSVLWDTLAQYEVYIHIYFKAMRGINLFMTNCYNKHYLQCCLPRYMIPDNVNALVGKNEHGVYLQYWK